MAHIKQVQVGQTSYLIEPTLYITPSLSDGVYSSSLADFALDVGVAIQVQFTDTNPADAQLKINDDTQYIYYNGNKIAASTFKTNHTYTLVYDGTQWQVVGDIDTDTIYTHPTTDGNLHVPATGTTNNGKFLKAGSTAGSVSWQSITKEDITNFPTSMTPTTHTHGNIQNNGTLQTNDITIADGDKLVITDASDSNKIARASISFDGSTATKALTQKGTWETFNNYSHPTGNGNKHIPSGGSSGQFLGWSSQGTAAWVNNPNTDITVKQTSNTTDTNAHPLLASAQTSPTSGTAYEAIYNTNIKIIPSTGALYATKVYSGGNEVLTSFTETDPTVPSWAKASSKPSYTASEVGALPSNTVVNKVKQTAKTNDVAYKLLLSAGGGTSISSGSDYEAVYYTGLTFNPNSKTLSINNGTDTGTLTATEYSGKAATAGNADTVNNLTVQTAVPANAVFTDTTYSAGTGLSLSDTTINHSNSVTEKTTYPSTATTASANGGTIIVRDIKYDAQGHITASTDRTITLSQTTYSTFVKSGSSAAAGLVPKPATTAGTTKFLREDATWKTAVTSIKIETSSPLTGGSATATTTTGTYTIGFSNQAHNTVLAGPSATNAANGAPTFRSLVIADLPVGTTSNDVAAGDHNHDSTYLTAVGYDSENKKIYYTKNNTNTDVITFGSNAFNSTAYLPLSGGTMTGNIHLDTDSSGDTTIDGVILLQNSGTKVIQLLRNSSNWGLALGWDNATHITDTYLPGIGYHNTENTISIVPYSTNISPWGRTVGLSIGAANMKFENNVVAHAGNVSTGDSNGQIKIAGVNVTVKNISDLAYIAKGSGSTKFLREDGTWQTALTAHQNLSAYAPLASPALTGTPTAPTATNGTNTTQIATTEFVNNTLAYANAMTFKGTLGTGGTITALPDSHEAGDTYRVITAGTYADMYCEVGTLIICITDGTTALNTDWTSVETNEDGSVIGPASSTDAHIAIFDGASGRIIKDSGFTIATSVPSDAVFTDVNVTATANTATTFYLIGSSSSSTATGTMLKSKDIYYTSTNTSGSRYSWLILGNTTKTSSSGGREGRIRLYGDVATYYMNLVPATGLTANQTITFPNKTGTLITGTTTTTANAIAIYSDTTATLANSTATIDSSGNITATSFIGDVTGNADTAAALETGRTLLVNLESTSASSAFDGTANITDIGVSGQLPIANGGTGVSSFTDSCVIIPSTTNNIQQLISSGLKITGTQGNNITLEPDTASKTMTIKSSTGAMTIATTSGALDIKTNSSTANKGNITLKTTGTKGTVSIESNKESVSISSGTSTSITAGTNISITSESSGAITITSGHSLSLSSDSSQDLSITSANDVILTDGSSKIAKLTGTAFQPGTDQSVDLGTSSIKWGKLYVGTAETYGDEYTPIYWNDGIPTEVAVVQEYTFSIASASTTAVIAPTNTNKAKSIITEIVVDSGIEYLNGPISWDVPTTGTNKDKIVLTTTATSGAVSGYILVSIG